MRGGTDRPCVRVDYAALVALAASRASAARVARDGAERVYGYGSDEWRYWEGQVCRWVGVGIWLARRSERAGAADPEGEYRRANGLYGA